MDKIEQVLNSPKHVAIIMDGNGRWAKSRSLPRVMGHRKGARAVRQAIEFAVEKRLSVLTLFTLSIENVKYRPKSEVNFLLDLFLQSLIKNTAELHANNIRIHVVGDLNSLDPKLCQQIDISQRITADNTGLDLVFALNYSGRWDMMQASAKLAEQVANKIIDVADINEQRLAQEFCLSQFDEPDLLIRTGKEKRISNFLLWQLAYSEFYFTDVYWPDFKKHTFNQALLDYQDRQRRYGFTSEQREVLENVEN